jgi:hypothetical protein
MGKRQSFEIGGETFKTKKSLVERIQKILHAYTEGQSLNIPDFKFMLDVLHLHPSMEQKVGCGVASMQVKKNPIYPSNRGFWLVRTDDTSTDFSFNKCLSPSSRKEKVQRAFRSAIEPYCFSFKQRFFDNISDGTTVCEYTGKHIKFLGSHVDHKPPNTFQKLFDDFLTENNLDVNQIETYGAGLDNVIQSEIADIELKNCWIQFHNERAELRVISAEANWSHVRYETKQSKSKELSG